LVSQRRTISSFSQNVNGSQFHPPRQLVDVARYSQLRKHTSHIHAASRIEQLLIVFGVRVGNAGIATNRSIQLRNKY